MPRIISSHNLKDTTAISQMCSESDEPVYITKNGYVDMVIMSMKVYKEKMFLADVYSRLAEAEADIEIGRVSDAREGLTALREKYGLRGR